ncbi:MAG: arylesterase [Gallionellales bacterium 35-53-114]|jgi:acyl-CoA thioesterase-1|nr:MAG: arylesterase [Gallionellales bacterium 35-53-114]OYZ63085.1 MAG: arylesterase [Gallionellales bacterium 24-53-125]OZB08934.1 MAG: arylesterase [Gallionellales bacterium 39-52-133]
MDAMKPSQIYRIVLLTILLLLPAVSSAQSTILVFGDSLSAGYGIPREAAWPSLLQAELNRTHPHYKVINASISGETTSGGVRRLPATLKEHRPSLVILELGANDGLRGTKLDLTEKSLNTLITQSQAAGAKVLLLGMQLPPNYGVAYTKKFKSLYPKLAQRHRIELVPFMLEGVEAHEFQADNLHPVAEAQPKILQTVLQKLKGML